MSKNDAEILCARAGPVATITFNRPLHRNSLTVECSTLLYQTLQSVASDETLRIVVLRGQGDDFCCGADIDAAAAGDHTACGDPDPYKVTQLLHAMPAVTLAAIRGGCAGAALGWACACDIRIASHSARFNTAFLKMGLAGDMAGIWFLTRLIGPTRARDLYLFPRKFSAQDAYSTYFPHISDGNSRQFSGRHF